MWARDGAVRVRQTEKSFGVIDVEKNAQEISNTKATPLHPAHMTGLDSELSRGFSGIGEYSDYYDSFEGFCRVGGVTELSGVEEGVAGYPWV